MTDGDGKRALVSGPWHSTPTQPTGTPAPARFKLGKQRVWTAYASPNVAERWRKELQNNARATAYISWITDDKLVWAMNDNMVGADTVTEIGAHQVPVEPMLPVLLHLPTFHVIAPLPVFLAR
ncbi:hypothetical protein B0H13DRAFT_2338946 [Mycena leptocephala]|nr:hypothetical protein B0H13DRAFT_2338946 [Mycena leptocephala]